jgi:hypothetical protein
MIVQNVTEKTICEAAGLEVGAGTGKHVELVVKACDISRNVVDVRIDLLAPAEFTADPKTASLGTFASWKAVRKYLPKIVTPRVLNLGIRHRRRPVGGKRGCGGDRESA